MNEREHLVVEAVRLETYTRLAEGVRFAYQGRDLKAGLVDWHCCVLATRVAVDVLKQHYIGAKALKVQVLTLNQKAWDLAKEGVPVEMAGLAEGANVYGCGLRGDGSQAFAEDGWLNGHVVALVENEVLLDPSAVQFTHLEDGILVEPLAVTLADELGSTWLRGNHDGWLAVELEDGGGLAYRKHPDLAGVYDSQDWKAPDNISYPHLLEAVSQAVKGRL